MDLMQYPPPMGSTIIKSIMYMIYVFTPLT